MKQDLKRGKNKKIGAFGEKIATGYLKKKGFVILETNYLKKYGEIDIVAHEATRGREIIRFVEVKTVSYGTRSDLEKSLRSKAWRPEENVTREKITKLSRAIESWLLENKRTSIDWQIDVVAVRIVPHEKYATIKYIENVII